MIFHHFSCYFCEMCCYCLGTYWRSSWITPGTSCFYFDVPANLPFWSWWCPSILLLLTTCGIPILVAVSSSPTSRGEGINIGETATIQANAVDARSDWATSDAITSRCRFATDLPIMKAMRLSYDFGLNCQRWWPIWTQEVVDVGSKTIAIMAIVTICV